MYFFGDNSLNAQILIDDIASWSGPGLPLEADFSEMNEEKTRTCLIYRSAALRDAVQGDMDQEVIDKLCEMYEEALAAFCKHSDIIHRALRLGAHIYPYPEENAVRRQKQIIKRYHGEATPMGSSLVEDRTKST